MQTAGGEVAAGVPCQRGVRPAAGAKSPRVSGSPPSRPGPGGVETERRGSRFTGRWQQARPRPAGRVSRCHTCVVPAPARCAASLAPHGGSPQRSHGGRARNRGGGAGEGRGLEPPRLTRPARDHGGTPRPGDARARGAQRACGQRGLASGFPPDTRKITGKSPVLFSLYRTLFHGHVWGHA